MHNAVEMLPSGQWYWFGRSSVEPSDSSAWCVDKMLMPSFPWGHKVRIQSSGTGINELQGVSQGTSGVLEEAVNFSVAHARGVTDRPWHIALLCLQVTFDRVAASMKSKTITASLAPFASRNRNKPTLQKEEKKHPSASPSWLSGGFGY